MAYTSILMIAGMVSLTYAKPVMVSFGTNQGPIVAAAPRSTTINPLAPRAAAPVFEQEVNAPPAPQYRPLTPHQYRNEIYSVRPNPNLILGTPLDIKYTPALNKVNLLRKAKVAQSEGFGVGYTGPHSFDVQVYELERAGKKSSAKAFVDQYKPQKRDDQQQTQNYQFNYEADRRQDQPQNYQYNYQFTNQQQPRNTGFVPQIGIVYSSGVRYYIPQITNDVDNSAYPKNYQYHQQY